MSESGQAREKKKRILSREQQAVWRRDQRESMRGKTREEKLAARAKMKSQLESMGEGDRAKLTKDLQAKWDALSESEKLAMQRKMKQRKRGGGGGGGGKKQRNKGDEDDD
jgi:predicted Fe-S protein YdhL (DUF1289 family)